MTCCFVLVHKIIHLWCNIQNLCVYFVSCPWGVLQLTLTQFQKHFILTHQFFAFNIPLDCQSIQNLKSSFENLPNTLDALGIAKHRTSMACIFSGNIDCLQLLSTSSTTQIIKCLGFPTQTKFSNKEYSSPVVQKPKLLCHGYFATSRTMS